jgi:carbon storage regulator
MTMLVLSRKIGERIVVPHCELSITVVSIERSTVRLGISAPAAIRVFRDEVWQRLCSESVRQDPLVTS